MMFLLSIFALFVLFFSVFCIVSIRRMPKASQPIKRVRTLEASLTSLAKIEKMEQRLESDTFNKTYDRIMSKMPKDSPSRISWEASGKEESQAATMDWRHWVATRGEEIREEIRQRRANGYGRNS